MHLIRYFKITRRIDQARDKHSGNEPEEEEENEKKKKKHRNLHFNAVVYALQERHDTGHIKIELNMQTARQTHDAHEKGASEEMTER
jgi:hypothetical protein